MQLIVFGTGKYYKKFKQYIEKEEILFFVDNDESKIGMCIDGNPIYNPSQIERVKYDYILILVRDYEPILAQLISKGIPEKKIITYKHLGEKIGVVPRVIVSENREEEWDKWIQKDEERTIVLFTNDFSRTGVPVATFNLAKLFKKMDYRPLCIGLHEGTLQRDLEKEKIPYISNYIIWSDNDTYLQKLKKVRAIFVVSVILSRLVLQLEALGRPIFWWLHESLPSLYEEAIQPCNEMQNIVYLLGGNRVAATLQKYFGDLKTEELLYYLPETKTVPNKIVCNRKIRIAVIGTICERKGQDICAAAVNVLWNLYGSQFETEYVGNIVDKNFANIVVKLDPNGIIIGELSQSEIDNYFKNLDILVCPSRDDPMPIVVTQAMQNSVACIVSDQVGQAEYINNGCNGFVFHNENIEELVGIIKELLISPQKIRIVGENGRIIYEQYFSEAKMRNKLNELLDRMD